MEVGIMAATAKLFMHGRSQAVRLPKEFRFEGTEVQVRRVGEQVILEPVDKPYNAAEFWAKIDAIGGARFLDDVDLDDVPPAPDRRVFFDE
jgi:antitoxin VapB